jgi:hypothetical protein
VFLCWKNAITFSSFSQYLNEALNNPIIEKAPRGGELELRGQMHKKGPRISPGALILAIKRYQSLAKNFN